MFPAERISSESARRGISRSVLSERRRRLLVGAVLALGVLGTAWIAPAWAQSVTDTPPPLADYGDAPDENLDCALPGGVGHFPTLFDTINAAPGRTAPYHVPTLPAGLADYELGFPLFGPAKDDEAVADQPFCDWASPGCDLDNAPLVLCLNAGCTSGVVAGGISPCGSLAVGTCFGPPPVAPVLGFWIFSVTRGPLNTAPGLVNVAVDWNLSGSYGDAKLEWALQDSPVAALAGASELKITSPFPVLTVTLGPLPGQWSLGPFWTRFHLSEEKMLESFDGVSFLWDGSGRLGGYEGGETEDYYAWCDPEGRHDFPDCDKNAVPDRIDILFGRLHDQDRNGVPDECERKVAPRPAISFASYGGGILTIAGENLSSSTSVEINGRLVGRSYEYDALSRLIRVRGSLAELNLQSRGVNQLVVIEKGERSLPFSFSLGKR